MRLIIVIWSLAPCSLQVAIAALLAKRRHYRRGLFPFFFAYTLYSILVTILRLVAVRWPTQYPTLYWRTEVIYGVLALLALNETFGRIFRLDYEEHPWFRYAVPLVALMAITGLFIWWRFIFNFPTGGRLAFSRALLYAFVFGVHLVEIALIGLFLLLRWLLAPGWNRYDYGVLVGFGISAAFTVSARFERIYSGSGNETWYQYAPGVGYVIAALIWLHAFWETPRPRQQSTLRIEAMLERVMRDNEIIRRVHKWLYRQNDSWK